MHRRKAAGSTPVPRIGAHRDTSTVTRYVPRTASRSGPRRRCGGGVHQLFQRYPGDLGLLAAVRLAQMCGEANYVESEGMSLRILGVG
jgi:hypothetical protein